MPVLCTMSLRWRGGYHCRHRREELVIVTKTLHLQQSNDHSHTYKRSKNDSSQWELKMEKKNLRERATHTKFRTGTRYILWLQVRPKNFWEEEIFCLFVHLCWLARPSPRCLATQAKMESGCRQASPPTVETAHA